MKAWPKDSTPAIRQLYEGFTLILMHFAHCTHCKVIRILWDLKVKIIDQPEPVALDERNGPTLTHVKPGGTQQAAAWHTVAEFPWCLQSENCLSIYHRAFG